MIGHAGPLPAGVASRVPTADMPAGDHTCTERMGPYGCAEGAEPQTVLGVVRQPESAEAFPGLYTTSLPERPFVDAGRAVLVNSQWGNQGVIIRVELGSGSVARVSDVEEAPGTWTLLDTDGSAHLPHTKNLIIHPETLSRLVKLGRLSLGRRSAGLPRVPPRSAAWSLLLCSRQSG